MRKEWSISIIPLPLRNSIRFKGYVDHSLQFLPLYKEKVARLGRIERPAPCLEGMCSFQLSYRRAKNLYYYNELVPSNFKRQSVSLKFAKQIL